jgi:hypothetical protein
VIIGPEGPEVRALPLEVPGLRAGGRHLEEWIRPDGGAPVFRAAGHPREVTLTPLNHSFDKRYSVCWRVV